MRTRILPALAAAALLFPLALTPSPAHAEDPAGPVTTVSVAPEPAEPDLNPTFPEPAAAEPVEEAPVETAPEQAPQAPPTVPPAPSGCTLDDPWDGDTQADDDCDGIANVCETLAPSEVWTAVVARGYGIDGYCVPTKAGLLHPPFPTCVLDDGADDYDCDGAADYYLSPTG